MPDPQATRLAVLIDADNTSASHAADLLEEVAKYGTPTVKRAYGDWTTPQLGGWKAELNRHAIQPVQQFAYTVGKNATDSALIIDAMDLLYSGNLEAFALVSSDSDFTRLATRLRESGTTVYGLGRRRTPEAFVAACDRFVFLEVLGSRATNAGANGAAGGEDDEQAAPLPDLHRLLSKAIESTSADDGWASLSAIGSYLGNSSASFDPRNYGFAKLSTLVRAQDWLEVDQPGGSGPMRLRVREEARPVVKKTTRSRSRAKAQPSG